MGSPFAHAMNEKITIVHKNGDRHENIRALVNKNNIITDQVAIPFSAGNKVERRLPSGQVESLIVTNAHLTKGHGGIPDFYSIEYVREGAQQYSSQPATVNVQVKNSPQTHVNLSSTDHSTNVINSQPEDIILEIRELLRESVADSEELDLLLERVNDMEHCLGSSNFIKAYQDFIAAAAAHMTILAPLLPPLSSLLTSAGG